MGQTPKYGLVWPENTQVADGPNQQRNFLQQVEDLLSIGAVDLTAGTLSVNTPTAAAHAARKADVDAVQASVTARTPSGAVVVFAGNTAPAGWLLCQGQAVPRTTYAGLYAVIGTVYGVGDGTTTFNLPNLRTRVPVGYDGATFPVFAGAGGEISHALSVAEIPSHTHGIRTRDYDYGSSPAAGADAVALGALSTTERPAGPFTDPAGGSAAHNNMPPYLAMHYIIRT